MLILGTILLPMAAAFPVYVLGRNPKSEQHRDILCAAITIITFFLTLILLFFNTSAQITGILSGSLSFTTDGFRCVYAIITSIMWMGTTFFSLEYFAHEKEGLAHYWFFNLVTFGATLGVMLSADFMSAFVFFEILSFTSFTWVIHEETDDAISAGYTYLFVAVIGGLILFMGLLLLQHAAGTLSFEALQTAAATSNQQGMILAAAICILLGFGAKAGMFPLHIWLPKAHPIAPSPASALLSGILTKVGIYGILMTAMYVMPENILFGELVLTLGLITMLLGAVLAVFSINLKRTLACSSMSQIGFILTGIGMYILLTEEGSKEGALLALSGLMLHMLNHSLIKLVLFMAAGVVIMNLHTLTLDNIRGWGKNKPLLGISFAFGALGISGVPFFNGYISKTLLHEGIVEGIHECVSIAGFLHAAEWIFLFSGGLTFAYMLKLFICIFVENNADAAKQNAFHTRTTYMSRFSGATIFLASLFMPLLGQPRIMTRIAAFMTDDDMILHFQAFTFENLKGGMISLCIGALVYLFFIRTVTLRSNSYVNLWPAWFDLEQRIYRPLLTKILPNVLGFIVSTPGENKILSPLSRFFMFWMGITHRILCDGMDFLILLLRKSIFRERHTDLSNADQITPLRALEKSAADTLGYLTGNFTFAMMMTCIGILMILIVLIGVSIF